MPKSFQMQLYGTSGSMSQQTINGVSTQQFTNATHQINVYQDLTYKIVPTGNTQNAIPNPNSLLSFSNGTHELRFYGDGRVSSTSYSSTRVQTEPTPMPKNLIIGTENMLPNVHKALS